MQAYLIFIDKITKLLEKSSVETQFQLALEICKKLYPDYENFSNKHNFGKPKLLKEAMDYCEKSFLNKNFNCQSLDLCLKKVVSHAPDTENHKDWDASYAVNASASVCELLAYLQDSRVKHISEICSLMIDTVDFKIAEANEHLSDDGIFNHPMMVEAMNEIIRKLE